MGIYILKWMFTNSNRLTQVIQELLMQENVSEIVVIKIFQQGGGGGLEL